MRKYYRVIIIKSLKSYQTADEINKLHTQIKLIRCPHCRLIGFLIMHGFLYGYNEKTNDSNFIRGRRIFCSNRNKRKGCGKTVSIFKTNIIKGFTFTTDTLWQFLINIYNGLNILKAFLELNIKASNATPYRLYHRFKIKQAPIRSLLSQIIHPPNTLTVDDPILQTIQHFKIAFNNKDNPLTELQYNFQRSII